MTTSHVHAVPGPYGSSYPVVIPVHCSGSSGRQWLDLAARLGDRFHVRPVDLIGSTDGPDWAGRGPIDLAAQAQTILATAGPDTGPVHLVGHSYGGAVALKAALALGPRLASLTLIEPSLFNILGGGDQSVCPLYQEIRSIADRVGTAVLAGDFHGAMAIFVDYWNRPGSWDRIKPSAQDRLAAQGLQAAMDFSALLGERTALVDYSRIAAPVLVLYGSDSPAPSITICKRLAAATHGAALHRVAGAGHMLPITHADHVNPLIDAFLSGSAFAPSFDAAA